MTTLEIPVPELVKRYQSGEIPATARATVTYEESAAPAVDPSLALIEEWLSQAPTDRDEFREAEEETRREGGARLLFPQVGES